MRNLGDKIAVPAQFIARGIDAVSGTNISGCSGCKDMQANLNSGMSLQDAIYERWFNAKQKGEKMKYQVTVVIEAEDFTKAVVKASSVGEVLNAQSKQERQQPTLPAVLTNMKTGQPVGGA